MTDTPAATPFHDLDDYLALPRLGALALSPDGRRLVASQAALDADRTRWSTALWEIDPDGEAPARRLTRGAKGEGGPAFTAAGDLLFVATRPGDGDDAKPCVWRLPAGGGEAYPLVRRPGGISAVHPARAADTVLVSADTLPGATDEASERRLRKARSENKVAAILHSGYPVRYWDHDLGPDAPRLFVVEGAPLAPAGDGDDGDALAAAPDEPGPDDERGTRDLTPDAGRALVEASSAISDDGTFAVASWSTFAGLAAQSHLVRIDVATGERRTLVRENEADLDEPAISPDGAWVAYIASSITSPQEAPRRTAWVVPATGGTPRRLAADWDRWPASLTWLPDSSGLLVTADEHGHSPVFRVALDGDAAPERLTAEGAFGSVVVDPAGTHAFATRSSYASPAEVVRLDLAEGVTAEDRVRVLRAPSERPTLPGRLEDVATTVTDPDGSTHTVRSWLALPEGASAENPAPLLLWIHGGPLGSWNAWSWRWNPWIMVARGYAVLLPDPALSTGYGQEFVQRGWGAWGDAPYTDLMAATDAVEQRDDVDASRTAAMGGSFGGYMANWVAGHTDRFDAVVTHASLWALDQFGPTTDASYYWQREMTPEMAAKHSPHAFVGDIRTPMLVIHGDKDYRVPIGEGLRLWTELLSSSGLPAAEDGSTVHRFLYYPDENHWILTPQHAKVWYEVVEGFLAEHVLGETRELPDVLGGAASAG
ncbi:S9 family peptidase [Litorihabitans aurantiacus]|uniref:Acyl-peptide hydrolase n=1 Tax=Litorihabitans aurantiacus TaxID=1930061 RepID=A0AA37XHQ0_9MICO|nr:alpha/beta fold hydrolase [Litorihabitans aurantiacus]GMA32780.1 peptidase S9 [Litorihabitans aurantiacus]